MSDRRRFVTFATLFGAGLGLICCVAPLLAGTMAFALSASLWSAPCLIGSADILPCVERYAAARAV